MNNDLANEIRSKIDIVDIIGERIPLVARGKNLFGVCPFHDDRSPSMCVSREKQIYTCFSCHATGNVFTFLMEYEHIDFKTALKELGDKVGINTSGILLPKKNTKYDKLYEAYNFAVKYFQNNLSSKIGKTAKNYLKERQITDDVIKEFGIGLSLDKKDDLTKLLLNKNYDLGTLNKIGLSNDDHDVYIERIMFPLYDTIGQAVGFSGRIYKNTDMNKYLNTKETEIFKKGELLYHYHVAREECRKEKCVIVMEGFMDVIRASTIDIRNTVALMGTALTKEQISLLKRLSNNIILCLDGDDAGVHATLSIGENLLEQGIEPKVIPLPSPEDPDSYILKNGKDKFLSLMEARLNFSDYKLAKLKEKVNFKSDEETANYINSVLEETSKLTDPIRIEVILKRLEKEFNIGYNTLDMRIKELTSKNANKIQLNKLSQVQSVKQEIKRKDKYIKAMEQVIYFMFFNDFAITCVEREHLVFKTEAMRALASEIIYYYNKYGSINVADFYTYIHDKSSLCDLYNEIIAANYIENTTKDDLFLYFKVIREYGKKQEINRLTNLMKKEVDPLEQAKIVEKIRNLRIGE